MGKVQGHNTNHGSLKHKVNHDGHETRNKRPESLLALIDNLDGAGGAGTTDAIGAPAAGDKITGITVDVTVAFDGAATLEVGTTADPDFIFPTGTIDLTDTSGPQALDLDLDWPINSVVRATLGGAPTVGTASIRTVYED